MQNISEQDMNILAMDMCSTLTGGRDFVRHPRRINDCQLLTIVTVAQFVTNLCINELERRNMLEACEDCGGPQVPYISDHGVLTIFTREDDEGQPAGAGQPTAH